MHGGMVEVAKYAHWTETEIHLGLHQQPKTMTMRHAGAMESTDGAHSKGLGFTCLSQERVIHQAKALWCLGGAVTDPIRLGLCGRPDLLTTRTSVAGLLH